METCFLRQYSYLDRYIIGFLLGCFTTLLGSIVNHLLSKRRERQKEFKEAADKFTLTFQTVLSELRYNGQKKVYDIITPELINHQNAYTIFGRYLSGSDLNNFNLAWKDYFTHAPQPGEAISAPEHHYSEWKEEDERTLVINKIENLLQFAKFKQYHA